MKQPIRLGHHEIDALLNGIDEDGVREIAATFIKYNLGTPSTSVSPLLRTARWVANLHIKYRCGRSQRAAGEEEAA